MLRPILNASRYLVIAAVVGALAASLALFIGVLPAAAASFVAGLLFLIAGASLLFFAICANTLPALAATKPDLLRAA